MLLQLGWFFRGEACRRRCPALSGRAWDAGGALDVAVAEARFDKRRDDGTAVQAVPLPAVHRFLGSGDEIGREVASAVVTKK